MSKTAAGAAKSPQAAADPLAVLEQEAAAARAAQDLHRTRAAYRALLSAGGQAPAHFLGLARACRALEDRAGMEEARAGLEALPPEPRSLLALGEILQLLGRSQAAVSAFRASAAAAPLPPHGWRLLAQALRGDGEEAAALAALQEGLKFHPNALHLKIDSLRLKAKLEPESLDSAELDELVGAHPRAEPAQALRLELLTRLGRAEAAAAAQAFLAAFPDSPRALAAAAREAARAGQQEEAARLYRQLLASGAGDLSHALQLARACRAAGDLAGVEEALEQLQSFPPSARRDRLSAEVLRHLSRHEEAVRALRQSAAQEPLPLGAWRQLIGSLREAEGLEAAAAAAEEASSAFPDDRWLQLRKLELRAALPSSAPAATLAAAIAEASVLVREHPLEAEAHLTRLRVLKAQGDEEAVRAAARSFLEALPEDQRARLECGRQAFAAGDHREALAHFAEARRRQPENCDHLFQMARCYNSLEEPEGVLACLEVLEQLPESAARERAISQILQLMQLQEEAVEPLKRALALDPLQRATWQQLVALLSRLGRGKEALGILADLPEGLRDTALEALLRSQAAWAAGEGEQAVAALRHLGPAHSFATRLRLASHLIWLNEPQEAEAELAAAVPENAAQRAQLELCRASLARRRFDTAAMFRHAESALKHRPQASEPFRVMAEAALIDFAPQACLDFLAQNLGRVQRSRRELTRPRLSTPGQIANEMLIEPELTAGLQALVRENNLAAIGELVSRSRTIGPALAFMIVARRRGLLERPDSRAAEPKPQDPHIPPIIHQYWEGTMPQDVAAAIEAMQRHNSWAEHRLYSPERALATLAEAGLEQAARAFRLARRPAERADILRLALLLQFGGFYVDVDDICLSSLACLAEPGLRLLLQQEWAGALANNFIAAEAGHPILADALEEVVEETLLGGNESIWLRSGPGLLTRAAARHIARVGPECFMRDHRIVLNGELSPFVAIHRPLSYKLGQRNWAIAERQADDFSIREFYASRKARPAEALSA